MSRPWFRTLALCSLYLAAPPAFAAEPLAAARSRPLALSAEDRQVLALAGKIDLYLQAARLRSHVQPAPLADDAEFLRRVSLDLAGRIPRVAEARAFLDDPSPDKRRRLVQRLLDGPGYVTQFTNVWRTWWLPEATSNLQVRALLPGFEAWLREQLVQNVPYDQMVREVLTVSFAPDMQSAAGPDDVQREASPVAFYLAREAKPEGLGAVTARLFLGLRLECAQCHDHPMDHWRRDQFWGFAAFFGGLQSRGGSFGPVREITGRNQLQIPGKDDVIEAAFLDDKKPEFKYKVSGRVTLADWITAPDNPYFARAAVNRLWAYFFGTGLVEPIDDFRAEHAPSHPELLDELARAFVAHHYDLKFLIRAITATQAYQLGSTRTDPGQDDPRLYARMAVRGLSPEQLFDGLAQATGYRDSTPRAAPRGLFELPSGPRAEFLAKFLGQDGGSDARTTILQALYLMNGKLVADVTDLERSQTLASVAEAPFLDTAGKVEALYLAALTRRPSAEESARLVAYVNGGGPRKDPRAALADVFWALLNSPEFILNH